MGQGRHKTQKNRAFGGNRAKEEDKNISEKEDQKKYEKRSLRIWLRSNCLTLKTKTKSIGVLKKKGGKQIYAHSKEIMQTLEQDDGQKKKKLQTGVISKRSKDKNNNS